jgi:hypothetical protein
LWWHSLHLSSTPSQVCCACTGWHLRVQTPAARGFTAFCIIFALSLFAILSKLISPCGLALEGGICTYDSKCPDHFRHFI